jgi:hypothetical protein
MRVAVNRYRSPALAEADLRCSNRIANNTPMAITTNVAVKLADVPQLMHVPTIPPISFADVPMMFIDRS